MRANSVQDHPVTNKPVYFIHPCQTAEVMQASVGDRPVDAAEYLMIWMGALGKCVGLNVPLALTRSDSN
jgi:ubiquitin-like-conjugating enzyme ATG10